RERQVAAEPDDRVAQRLHLARRHEVAGEAVLDELAEAADRGGDHRPRALHRLERDHAEALAHRRNDDDRRALDRALHRRDVAEEANCVADLELAAEVSQCRLERPAPANARSKTTWPLIGIRRPTQRRRGLRPRYGFGSPSGSIP